MCRSPQRPHCRPLLRRSSFHRWWCRHDQDGWRSFPRDRCSVRYSIPAFVQRWCIAAGHRTPARSSADASAARRRTIGRACSRAARIVHRAASRRTDARVATGAGTAGPLVAIAGCAASNDKTIAPLPPQGKNALQSPRKRKTQKHWTNGTQECSYCTRGVKLNGLLGWRTATYDI